MTVATFYVSLNCNGGKGVYELTALPLPIHANAQNVGKEKRLVTAQSPTESSALQPLVLG